MIMINKLRASLLLFNLCVCASTSTFLHAPAALAQQGHYEFVPGSRQARWVPGPAPAPGQSGQGSANSAQGQGAVPTGQVRYIRRGNYLIPVDESGRQMSVPTQAPAQAQRSAQPAQSTQSPQTKSGSRHGADYSDTVSVDGTMRSYVIHVPPGYDGKQALPVVLAFHGLGMNATAMYGLTGFTGLSDRKGFIAVFPNAAGGRWQDGLSSGTDDVAFVQAMLAKLSRTMSIDTRRVYACGISNGGYFSQLLALSIPDKIAAAGVVASTLTKGGAAAAGQARAVPIVFFLGTDDALLPWGDGRNKDLGKLGEVLGISALGSIDSPLAKMGGLYSVPETIGFWTSHNGANGNAYTSREPDKATNDGTKVEKDSYGSGNNQVLVYRIIGGGHTWPGALQIKAVSDISGNISQDIDATELLWEFFKNHSR